MNRDDEIGGLWLRESRAGKKYMSGKIGGQEVVIFRNDHKQPGERTPDYRVYRSAPRDAGPPEPSQAARATAAQVQREFPGSTATVERRGGGRRPDDLDDDIPFHMEWRV